MITHPVLLLIFATANIVAGLGWAFIGITLVPHVRPLRRRTRAFGVIATLGSGVAHFLLAALVLFNGDLTAREASETWFIVAMHVLVAATIWAFLAGVYIEVGRAVPTLLAKEAMRKEMGEK